MPASLRRAALIAGIALLTACATPQSEAPPESLPTLAPTATPQPSHLDTTKLAELIARLRNGEYSDVTSLLIAYDDQVLVEEYYGIYSRHDLQTIYSDTKSFMSAAMGIAIEEGYVNSVDDLVLDYYPDYAWVAEYDPLAAQMTIDDLLTMRGGYEWSEVSTRGDVSQDINNMLASNTYVNYLFSRQHVTPPGTTYVYGSYAPILLSGIINEQTGQSVEDFLADRMFAPLGIDSWEWAHDSLGVSNTGWDLRLTPLEMLKFGVLYLNEGEWQGQQIISPEWIAESTRAHVRLSNRDYGYFWWRFPDDSLIGRRLEINDAYFAAGAGGQYILVVPHLNLVVVSTATDFSTDVFIDMLKDFILPFAIENATNCDSLEPDCQE